MHLKNMSFFLLAFGISLLGATYRWGDSAHSIGLISERGGKVRHPSFLKSGKNRYALIATATVIPPYRGDARVVLEGEPEMDHEIYVSGPAIDLGLRRLPQFRDSVLYGLQQKDRIAIWVVMKPPVIDPVCRMAYEKGFINHTYKGKDYYFCSKWCLSSFRKEPERYKDRDSVSGKYTLAFYDTKTGKSILRVPAILKGKGDTKDECGHH